MILYHFTSRQHMPLVRQSGLTKGVLPWRVNPDGEIGLVPGWQWLTQNASWDQEWARTMIRVEAPIRRDAYRIVVDVPQGELRQLFTWAEIRDRYLPESREYIDSFPEAVDWYLFFGEIPPAWFVKIEPNPFRTDLVLEVEA